MAIPDSGERTEVYKTADLVLPYKMVRADGRLNISGTIHFERSIAENFAVIGYFHMEAILVDAQGRVQGVYGLVTTTQYNTEYVTPSSPPLTFSTTIAVFDNTRSVAFSYTGLASNYAQSGGGGASFWEYPYR